MNFLNRGRKKCIKPIDVGMSNATYTDEFINLIDKTSIYAVVSTKGAIKELYINKDRDKMLSEITEKNLRTYGFFKFFVKKQFINLSPG